MTAQVLEPLIRQTASAAQAGQLYARELSNVAHGAAKCRDSIDLDILFVALASAAQQRLATFNAQDLAKTAWAFAKAARSDELLFVALARKAQQLLATFNAQDLANTAWAFATAARSDELLFVALAREAQQRLPTFNAQSIANTAWAFATAA